MAGSTTPAATFTDSTGVTPQANPIILNARGCPANPIWLQSGQAYKLVITDANTVTLPPTLDNVTGINDPALAAITDQWVLYIGAPTYISATSFSVAGDQTLTLQVNRRVKTTNTGGTTYSTIRTSTFAAGITTVVVANSSGTLDSGLSAVSYGIVSYTNGSLPIQAGQLLNVRILSNGVYTPTTGTTAVVVEVQGGGGAGGGAAVTGGAQVAAGGGGGAGGFSKTYLTTGFSGVTVTLGAAGTAAAGAVGGTGGTSSFGAIITATGGTGGAAGTAAASATVQPGAAGGAGGVGAGGNLVNAAGEAGDHAFYCTAPASGKGGASYIGAGAPCVVNASSAGTTAVSAGSGGSGGVLLPSVAVANLGGAGAVGAVTVWEYA